MFNVGQIIYYMKDNRPHSAPIQARMIVNNLHDDWDCTKEQRGLFNPFGKAGVMYSTCHGLVNAVDAFGSKEAMFEAMSV